jgi:hypothetical protein
MNTRAFSVTIHYTYRINIVHVASLSTSIFAVRATYIDSSFILYLWHVDHRFRGQQFVCGILNRIRVEQLDSVKSLHPNRA